MFWLIRAARYLRVPPWELAEQPVGWQDWALLIESSENWAANERQAHELARMKQRG